MVITSVREDFLEAASGILQSSHSVSIVGGELVTSHLKEERGKGR